MTKAWRFHLLGLAHIPTSAEVSCCAYSQKIRKLARMLGSLGHEVIFYGAEGSQVECSEFVPVISDEQRVKVVGDYDWRTEFFRQDSSDFAHQLFNAGAIVAINARKQPTDFVLATMGLAHKPITDAVGLPRTIESGIGYEGIYAQFRVFESYAWMHYLYGKTGVKDGVWYDAVIPNFFDTAEFPVGRQNGGYCLYLGRLIKRKGLEVAVQATREAGCTLVVAGQGSLRGAELNISAEHVTHVGSVGPAERARLLGGARAVLMPTYYLEPFGGVAVEAQLCGTPVITSDWGAFPETVLHGVTGWRCRTLDDFVWAIRHAPDLHRRRIRKWAERNYSLSRVAAMYQEYFGKIADLAGRGWYEVHRGRRELDWLKRFTV